MVDCRKSGLVGLAALAVVFAGFACGGTEVVENRPPEAVGEFPDLDVVEGESWTGSVDPFFTDPDGDTLKYTVDSSDTDVVAATINGSRLTLEAVGEGESTITLTATDPDGLSAELEGEVTVTPPNRPPVVQSPIPDLPIEEGESLDIDVSFVFVDPDGDRLTITAESDDVGVATVSVDAFIVTVTGIDAGTANITVTATDPGGLSVSDTFVLTVEEGS